MKVRNPPVIVRFLLLLIAVHVQNTMRAAEPGAVRTKKPLEQEAAARVDSAVLQTFDKLPPVPSLTDDEAFLRRVSLDLSGKVPTPEELEGFVSSREPNKRAKQIEKLLASDGYS